MDDEHGNELDVSPAEVKEIYSAPDVEAVSAGKELSHMETIDSGSEESMFNVTAAQEETRAKIALYFTRAFLVLVGLALAAPFILNFGIPQLVPQPVDAAKELVTILASVLAGPFGFIVGFYFKQGQDNNG